MITISIADLTMWEACDLPSRVAAIRAHLARDIADDEPIPLTTWAEITPDLDDLIWALERTPDGRAILAGFACDCAERVLPIWLAAYPEDDRPAAAIRVGRDPASTPAERAAARAAAWAAEGAAAGDAASVWQRACLLALVGSVDTGMQTIGAQQPVDIGATRTVVERGVQYSYRRAAGATSATISASMASDNGGTGPHFTTTTTHLDDFWRAMQPDGFCRCIRVGFEQLTHALTMVA